MKSLVMLMNVVALCLVTTFGFAQETIVMGMSNNGTTVNLTDCYAILYDSGGANGNYSDNENYMLTVCIPDNISMELDVSMNTEAGHDFLTIFEGSGTSGDIIARRIGGSSFSGHYRINSSCATFVWHSDFLICIYSGFVVEISCAPACQDFTIVPDINADWNDEEGRFEACPNSPVEISVHGDFPNNDALNGYHQSDENLNWTWTWFDGAEQHQAEGIGMNMFVTNLATGTYDINVSATDSNGCVHDTTLYVIVRDYDNPRCCITPTTAMITSSGSVCANTTILSAQPPADGNTGEWSVVAYPDGDSVSNSAVFANPNYSTTHITVNGWGTYTFRWSEHYVGMEYCVDFAEVTIEFKQPPTSTFTYTPIICYGDETHIAYSGNMGADADFLWNFDGGVVQYGATSLGPHTVSWSEAGTHSVSLSVSNDGCVSACTLVEIIEPQPMKVLPMNNVTICKGQSAILTTQVFGGTPFYDYAWSGSDGTSYHGSVFSVSPLKNTTYLLTVTDANGCSVQLPPVTVSVNPDLRFVSVIANNDTVCAGDEVFIYVETEGGNGGPYTLALQDGRIVSPPFSVRTDTTAMFYITLSDMCGTPPVVDSVLINVYPLPKETFIAKNLSGCVPLSVEFLPLKMNGTKYLWQFGDNDFSEAEAPVHTYSMSGDFDVTMSVTDEYGCMAEHTIPNMIHVFPRPRAIFDAENESVSALSAEVLFVNRSIYAVRYFWSFGDNDSSMFENPRHFYPAAGEYEVVLVTENEYFCTDTTSRIIMVYNEDSFYAPTAFTPNGDGINDCFRICGSGISKNNFLLMVYDCWGELVFQTTDYFLDASCDACSAGSWDGTDNGSKRKGDKVLPNGIYHWYCQFEDVFGNLHKEQGVVNLVR